ncbi:site-specific integrase [Bradyrhizobium sp. ARR65]|uniref:site-specific integrase n=1 Tax=Bradyrhizobium sp. ARR65 TaxID=1040989 RepID=UPI0004679839|nr:site-specific integrase [Bradyrhizobium sp. ARR65]
MPRVSHLIRRNGVYWFKIDLPDDLAGRFLPSPVPDIVKQLESPSRRGHLKTAIWLSLRTAVEREARQRVGIQAARHAVLFEAARAFLRHGDTAPDRTELPLDHGLMLRSLGELTIECSIKPDAARSSLPCRPAFRDALERGSGTQSVASDDDWTISKAFKSWSIGGGVKGAKKPAPNTVIEAEAALRRFVELHGDMPVHQIGKAHGREFRDAIAKIPKGLSAELRLLSLNQLLERDLSAYETRSATTINKSLTLLGAVLARAEQDGHFDGTGWRNPFDVAFDVDPADEDYYEPFSKDELNRLLATRIFSAGERPRRGRGDTAKWAPLVALFQGARRTEVIQLLVDDIGKDAETGLWTLRFDREGDKRIKTVSSIRRVPVHPQLIQLGFIDFVQRRRKFVGPSGSLWPGFEDRSKLKSRANKWSEWFNGYLVQHVVDNPIKKFHSFRHTFKRFARAAGLDEVIINHLVGHSNKSVGARYGRKRDADGVRDSGYPTLRLAEEISRVRFDGVRFEGIA